MVLYSACLCATFVLRVEIVMRTCDLEVEADGEAEEEEISWNGDDCAYGAARIKGDESDMMSEARARVDFMAFGCI